MSLDNLPLNFFVVLSLHSLFPLSSVVPSIAGASSQMNSVKRCVVEEDRISRLPDELIQHILSCLPLREAVGTSILSRRWRCVWMTLKELHFDKDCIPFPSPDKSDNDRLVKIIDSVLLLHQGSVEKFSLWDFEGTGDIDRWIRYLTRFSISDLDIYLQWNLPFFKIPSCLFHCRDLVKLELTCCSLNIPVPFRGFRNLRMLALYYVDMTPDSLERLISGCPRLSELYMEELLIDGSSCLTIDAPNLEEVEIRAEVLDVTFCCKALLRVEVGFWFTMDKHEHAPAIGYPSNLHKFIANLPPHVEHISMVQNFIKYLSIGEVPALSPNPIINLEFLFADIDLTCPGEVATVLCLLRSSPNLKKLELRENRSIENSSDDYKSEDWSRIYGLPSPFEALRLVTFWGLSSRPPEMSFMKFLLLNTPVLEKMEVRFTHLDSGVAEANKLLEELKQSQRVSAQAEIGEIPRVRSFHLSKSTYIG